MDPWRLENSPYTPEGEIEGAGRFATGARRARHRRRQWVAALVVAAVLLPFVLQLVQVLS